MAVSDFSEGALYTTGARTVKAASEMGHLDQSSKGGIIDTLTSLQKPRKILIHINNTNPILNEESEERKILNSNNIEVSYDGMDIII